VYTYKSKSKSFNLNFFLSSFVYLKRIENGTKIQSWKGQGREEEEGREG
jgi:hypothetical protein